MLENTVFQFSDNFTAIQDSKWAQNSLQVYGQYTLGVYKKIIQRMEDKPQCLYDLDPSQRKIQPLSLRSKQTE